MNGFLSQVGVLFVAACCIAGIAVFWQFLLEYNAKLKRERAAARKNEEDR